MTVEDLAARLEPSRDVPVYVDNGGKRWVSDSHFTAWQEYADTLKAAALRSAEQPVADGDVRVPGGGEMSKLDDFEKMLSVEVGIRSDTHGVYVGGRKAALCVVINAAYEEAARAIERNITNHGKRKGGSDAGDAARRVDVATVRNLKMDFANKWRKP